MDTSGLASSLSLAAFLIAFAYLSLVRGLIAPGVTYLRPPDRLRRSLGTLRVLRLACIVAAVLSAESLALGQRGPSVGYVAVIAIDSLAVVGVVHLVAKLIAGRNSTAMSFLAAPFLISLMRPARLSTLEGTMIGEPEAGDGWDGGEGSLDPAGQDVPVLTEQEQAELDARERLMIRSILRLDETTAREIMIPRVDIVAIEADTPLPKVSSRMLESGHSRLPVYRTAIDDVIGVVHSRDLLPFLGAADEYPLLEGTLRPAYFIPESKRLDELLKEMQEKRVQLALVVDEYGGIEGLVTLEDLLEEIVGEIEDEFSHTIEPPITHLDNGDVIADARVGLDDLPELFPAPVVEENVDTVGGLVYTALGKVPQPGDTVFYDGLRLEVVSVLGRRIRKVKLSRVGGGPQED